jgi:hypothetical protein
MAAERAPSSSPPKAPPAMADMVGTDIESIAKSLPQELGQLPFNTSCPIFLRTNTNKSEF